MIAVNSHGEVMCKGCRGYRDALYLVVMGVLRGEIWHLWLCRQCSWQLLSAPGDQLVLNTPIGTIVADECVVSSRAMNPVAEGIDQKYY